MPGRYTVTSTQDSTYALCPRRWWFQYVLRIPQERHDFFTLGSVLHQCAERFHFGGVRKIVPTLEEARLMTADPDPFAPGGALFGQTPGAKMELFPPHFHKLLERNGEWVELSKASDRMKVVSLIEAAIQNGTLTHMPDQMIEDIVQHPLSEGMSYRSFIDHCDYLMAEGRDHKTAGAQKSLKTPRGLSKDIQQLAYGMHILFKRREMGLEDPDLVQIRHNQFPKWGAKPRHVYAEEKRGVRGVSVESLEKNWQRLIAVSKLMKVMLDEGPHLEWERIQGPEPGSGACAKYGRHGCQFQRICNKAIPVTDMVTIDIPMADKTIPVPTPTPMTSKTAKPTPIPSAADMPPVLWADPNCPACNGRGISGELTHCGQCHGNATIGDQPFWSDLAHDESTNEWVLRYLLPMPKDLYVALSADNDVPGVLGYRITNNSFQFVYPMPSGDYPMEDETSMFIDPRDWVPEFDITAPVKVAAAVKEMPKPPGAKKDAGPKPPGAKAAPAVVTPPTPESAGATEVEYEEAEPAVEPPAPAADVVDAPALAEPEEGESPLAGDWAKALAANDYAALLEVGQAIFLGKKSTSKRGRPAITFAIAMGDTAVSGFGTEVCGELMVEACKMIVAAQLGGATYFDCDTWKRRTALARCAPLISESSKGCLLRFSTITPETQDLIAALTALASYRIGL